MQLDYSILTRLLILTQLVVLVRNQLKSPNMSCCSHQLSKNTSLPSPQTVHMRTHTHLRKAAVPVPYHRQIGQLAGATH